MQLLTGTYLFNDPTGTPTSYFIALTVVFGILFVGSALVFWRRAKLAPESPALRRLIRRAAKAGMWTAGFGLFFCLMRYISFPYLDYPIFLLLVIFAAIFTVGYFVYELSERYPVAAYQLQQSHLERRFRPVQQRRGAPQRPRPKVRGKRRR